MTLEFAKLNGLGNDFVFVDNMDGSISVTEEQVKAICDRHFGVGADGVILVERSPREECAAYMHYINSDGTLAQMCGNGVRCFAKYLVDRALVDPASGSFVADTLAGPKPISFETDDAGAMTTATVNMGMPVFDPASVPVDAQPNFTSPEPGPCLVDFPVDSPWGEFMFTCVSMGNPHAVCFVEDWNSLHDELFADPARKSLDSLDLDRIGAYYESNPVFPEKANIEFATVVGDVVKMRVFERGCGETLACGTGACATRVAAALTGRASRNGVVALKGGDLLIEWTEGNDVLMTGPAEESFVGVLRVA